MGHNGSQCFDLSANFNKIGGVQGAHEPRMNAPFRMSSMYTSYAGLTLKLYLPRRDPTGARRSGSPGPLSLRCRPPSCRQGGAGIDRRGAFARLQMMFQRLAIPLRWILPKLTRYATRISLSRGAWSKSRHPPTGRTAPSLRFSWWALCNWVKQPARVPLWRYCRFAERPPMLGAAH